ncbi:flagellar protein FlgN [Sphingomonas changnyeongensis]|uniref:Flagellar protein FlgN n=1 Tax=Sphingomonas changnyeongensis TaxID=2698679 RepID=A0A7Z2S801_9SPHN|nr:flagellar protein FlgN [Sphingomonas changnyeongensis]QHL90162.1 flagellar protein FlgN [Sphingomonas changnyeongensis]
MSRIEALGQVITSLNAELAALKAFDIVALAEATDIKEQRIALLASGQDNPLSTEERALAEEAMRLNELARVYVNLMSANVRQRLEALTGTAPVAYTPRAAA